MLGGGSEGDEDRAGTGFTPRISPGSILCLDVLTVGFSTDSTDVPASVLTRKGAWSMITFGIDFVGRGGMMGICAGCSRAAMPAVRIAGFSWFDVVGVGSDIDRSPGASFFFGRGGMDGC